MGAQAGNDATVQQRDGHGRPAALNDLAFDMNFDPVTAQKIRDVHRMKEAAVANEEYDTAKRLKRVLPHS
jgi:hypothetical protein